MIPMLSKPEFPNNMHTTVRSPFSPLSRVLALLLLLLGGGHHLLQPRNAASQPRNGLSRPFSYTSSLRHMMRWLSRLVGQESVEVEEVGVGVMYTQRPRKKTHQQQQHLSCEFGEKMLTYRHSVKRYFVNTGRNKMHRGLPHTISTFSVRV